MLEANKQKRENERSVNKMTGQVNYQRKKESKEGHMGDALALGGEEGRDKLRKAAVRGKCSVIRRYPNGATQQVSNLLHA